MDICSGEAYVRMRSEYESIIRSQNITIKRLQKERDDFSFSLKKITRQWTDVLADAQGLIVKQQGKDRKEAGCPAGTPASSPETDETSFPGR